jgi:(p)ppGpp synthase/HD superfamily hydrolase
MKIKNQTIQSLIRKTIGLGLIWAMLIGFSCDFAYANPNSPVLTENLSPKINLSYPGFTDLIRQSYSDVKQDFDQLEHGQAVNLLEESYQKKQRTILQAQILDNFTKYHPQKRNDIDLIKMLFKIAEKNYNQDKFETGEYLYNHTLEVAEIASRNSAGKEEILAAVFHRMPTSRLNSVIDDLQDAMEEKYGASTGRRKTEEFRKKELGQINKLIKQFLKIAELKFYVHSQGAHAIENFMGAIINLTQGDFRVLRLALADKQASIMHASELEKEDLIEQIQYICGPLAGRFGMFEIKKELENAVFKIHNPEGYATVMRKVRNTYGVDYEQLGSNLEQAKSLVEKIAEANGIKAYISARVKAPYRIYVKENIVSEGNKDVLNSVDTIGIKIVCDNMDCYYQMVAEVRQALKQRKFGNWEEKKFKGKDNFKNFRDENGVVLDINYLQLREINSKANLEIQFLTKKADTIREIEFGHWFYEIERQTGRKQKFDSVEEFGFYELYDMYKKALEDPDVEEVNLYTVIEDYFRSVFEYNSQWVYVFEKSSEYIEGQLCDVLIPKRLKKGANGIVFSAQSGVNKLDKDYNGLISYEWKGEKLVAKSQETDFRSPLNDGDIVEVKTQENALINRFAVDPQLFTSLNSFPRHRILLHQAISSEQKRKGLEEIARIDILEEFSKRGINWSQSNVREVKAREKFFKDAANVFGLLNQHELLIGLALNELKAEDAINASEEYKEKISFGNQKNKIIQAEDIVAFAWERGRSLLRSEIMFDDIDIQSSIIEMYKTRSLDQLIIEVGIGKLKPETIAKKLTEQKKVRINYDYSTGNFSFIVMVAVDRPKIKDVQMKRAKEEIISILKTNGMQIKDDFNDTIRAQKLSKKFKLSFKIPASFEQGQAIGKALEAVGEVKTKLDKKAKQAAMVETGIRIKVQNQGHWDNILKRLSLMAKEYHYDPQTNEALVVIKFNRAEYENILDIINLTPRDVEFIATNMARRTMLIKKRNKLEKQSLIETAI